MTDNLLQKARTLTKQEVFGNPQHNVQYALALCTELKNQGHVCVIMEQEPVDVRFMLEKVYLDDEIAKQKMKNVNMTAASKREFIMTWRNVNSSMLQEIGLGLPVPGQPTYPFFSGIFFSPSYTKSALPYLQQVFQADACHTSFGKYTMYTCYGTTANCNTYMIATMILLEMKLRLVGYCFLKM